MNKLFQTRRSRVQLVLMAIWVAGWTLYANLGFERFCPLEGGSSFECAWNNVDMIWTNDSWLYYLAGLVVPALLIIGYEWIGQGTAK